MNRLVLVVGAVSLALIISCGGGKDDPQEAKICGSLICGANQTCDTDSSPPACRCKPAFTGPDCATCARGYTMDGTSCKAVLIDCSITPAICGRGGRCVKPTDGVDHCECTTGYTGHTCQVCADGYQDNDNNGTCVAGCKNTTMTCGQSYVCADSSGTARCECPAGTTGVNCSQCTSGAVRQTDGTCRI
jgi:hypothetical protein